MVSLGDVERVVAGLPETEETTRHGTQTWKVGGKAYAWVRPFSKADLKRFGDETPPDGPILALTVEDLAEKEAVLAAGAEAGVFTIADFNGHAAVLVQRDKVPATVLEEALLDGGADQAPPAGAKPHP